LSCREKHRDEAMPDKYCLNCKEKMVRPDGIHRANFIKRLYCSKECRANCSPRHKVPDPIKHCRNCGQRFYRRIIKDDIESKSSFRARIHCGEDCRNDRHLLFRQIHIIAAKHKKGACEICGESIARLSVHHRNKNGRDNSPENLLTLCNSCHSAVHVKMRRAHKLLEAAHA